MNFRFLFQCDSQSKCVIAELQNISKEDKNSDYDISEFTLKETFTNLMLAGNIFPVMEILFLKFDVFWEKNENVA